MHKLEKFQIDFINEAINSNALQFGDFILKSGRKSPYFFNASKLLTNANLKVVIDSFVARLKLSSIAIDQIFGPAYKGTIFGSMLGMKMNEEIKNLSLCFNRKEIKDHGEGGEFIGDLPMGNVLIVDDVLSAGTAAKEAIELIKKYNAKPVGLLIGLDRQEKGSHELSAKAELKKEFDIEVFSIINLDDLISYLHDKDYQSQQKLMNEYRSKWGA